ncbi:peptidylprolyl isomerase [Lysobacter sp. D1-1-M9]|uniref:peptidylprolyl isomerase n=1 Tax=Novilysobacter longmucuonensis TaxID=3098603 RepID=UPI002FCA79C8
MKKLFACLLAAALLAASVQAQQVQPIDGIAAVVDEDVILRSELDRALNNVLLQYAGRSEQLPPREILERQVLERLVLINLQVARAAGTGVRVGDQEVDQAIAGIAAQNQVSVEQLARQVASDGTSYAEFRDSIRDELIIQRLRQRFAQTRVSVSDAEIDAALESQQASGAQFHLAHILVALPEGATPEQIAIAQQKVEGIKGLLDRGEMDFAAAAVRYSDSPNALEGGDLGWRSLDEIPVAFATLVRDMAPGEVSATLRGPSGFQLLQMVETRDASEDGPDLVTQYHGRHILVRVDPNVSDAAAKAEIDTLGARIAGGADFAEVAREHSDDPSSQSRGGDLGWFTADQFGPDFGAQITSLQDGQVSKPFRTPAGWHIVERLGSRQSDVGADNRRAQVSETIGRRKLEDEWNRFLREMRGEAYVDYRIGPPDDDASGNAPDAPAPASDG